LMSGTMVATGWMPRLCVKYKAERARGGFSGFPKYSIPVIAVVRFARVLQDTLSCVHCIPVGFIRSLSLLPYSNRLRRLVLSRCGPSRYSRRSPPHCACCCPRRSPCRSSNHCPHLRRRDHRSHLVRGSARRLCSVRCRQLFLLRVSWPRTTSKYRCPPRHHSVASIRHR